MPISLRLEFSRPPLLVPFSYPGLLAGLFHRLCGPNSGHDALSLYSLGWLEGGRGTAQGLEFKGRASWRVRLWPDEMAQSFARGACAEITRTGVALCGMRLVSVEADKSPSWDTGAQSQEQEVELRALSPARLDCRAHDGPHAEYLRFGDPRCGEVLLRVWRRKMAAAGLDPQEARSLEFVACPKARTRLVAIHSQRIVANQCPLRAVGTTRALRFLWHVGAGMGTGVGFGMVGAQRNAAANARAANAPPSQPEEASR